MSHICVILVFTLLTIGFCCADEYGYIDIRSDNNGAIVYVDDEEVGKAPLDGPLMVLAGTHHVKIGNIEKHRSVKPGATVIVDMRSPDEPSQRTDTGGKNVLGPFMAAILGLGFVFAYIVVQALFQSILSD